MDIKAAEESLDKVLAYYQQHGITLSYRPKLEYVNKVCPYFRGAVAMVRHEAEFLDKITEGLSELFPEGVSTPWREAYGLEASGEALEEFNEVMKARLEAVIGSEDFEDPFDESDADILIFKTLNDQLHDPEIIEEIMAHEVWHLVEKEQGIFDHNLFIREGTATYASISYSGFSCDTPLEEFDELMLVLYRGAANIVQSHVADSANPFQAMLDPELRRKIEKEFLERIRPVVFELSRKTYENKEYGESLAYVLGLLPEFNVLERSVTHENILKVYRDIGATKLADELKGQNLDRLVDWYKLIFNNPPYQDQPNKNQQ